MLKRFDYLLGNHLRSISLRPLTFCPIRGMVGLVQVASLKHRVAPFSFPSTSPPDDSVHPPSAKLCYKANCNIELEKFKSFVKRQVPPFKEI